MAIGGEAVDFAYLGSSKSFHGRSTARSQHPAAADIDDLSGDILGFFGCEKSYRGSNIFDRGRATDWKTRVADFAGFLQRQLIFIDARRVHNVYGDPVLGFLER